MQVVFVSNIIKRHVSAIVGDTATTKFLYTIAKVVLRKHKVRPIFYGLFINGRIIAGDDTLARSLLGSQSGPLYLQILIPEIVCNMLDKPLEDQFRILKDIKNISRPSPSTRADEPRCDREVDTPACGSASRDSRGTCVAPRKTVKK